MLCLREQLLLLRVSPESVELSAEACDEAHEVVHEFLLCRDFWACVQDGDGCSCLVDDVFEVGVSEAGEAVLIGDVYVLDFSCFCVFD